MCAEPAGMRVVFFDGPISAFALSATLVLSLSLGGCSHSNTPLAMDARAEVWTPPAGGTYPPIGDTPPTREQPVMTADEQAKLRRELTSARGRQIAAVKAREGGEK